ncbi:NAD(P)/FAD-dependent oxidoreductase [Plantibacter sp. VKM Ac-2885]|uniref:NAD(P)/FAD-dependent oxidoreductase n=1 Tax=Plantibacter sp. VKM Ac-2885 TaxID=2783828 RepID=UPI001889E8D4|nr:NAD(P)/FAD-dependent oxidoreductase [Plantibacter sp. VKM Ac-2885]MBF4514091.1 NAD(P)/FAD-dependent oxidoreductase [Plantibacter sp. VKM Ac-2885]
MSTLNVEVVVIGGGSAGLSAALTLARARRRVVVIDGGEPRNAPAKGAQGLLGQEGVNPFELLRKGREEVISYGGQIISGQVTEAHAERGDFRVRTDAGDDVTAQTVLLATGTRDQLPDIPGLADRWGKEVIHCPYCHGWEIQDQRIGVLATGPMSALQALMFSQWSADVQFFSQGLDYSSTDLAKLEATGVRIDTRTITLVEVEGDRLAGVRLDDGSAVALDALVVPTATRARLDGLDGLGLEISESPAGTAVTVDAAGHTSVPGVWAAGNLAQPATQVSESAANGARVAMTLNTELIFKHASRAAQEAENHR